MPSRTRMQILFIDFPHLCLFISFLGGGSERSLPQKATKRSKTLVNLVPFCGQRLAARDGGNDSDFGAGAHRSGQVVEEPNILPIEIDINEATQRAGLIAHA